ncbi:hypothetical protein SPTER_26500 [Sporomusa termitida]|uniref:Uncharacterized protein n=2 Tax=Sporomusa termitida TaxID=2377 RepID=A0A517DV83_9FIRM|nr:hypothetical protein SPTER_26500 [Sporomusa termitida]
MITAEMIHQLRLELWNLTYTQWKTQILFTVQWWSLVVLVAISYAIWWVIVDKQRLSQILLFGSFVAVGRIVMDIIASNIGLWSYNIRETPFIPTPFLHDFTLTPLALMAVHQYCHSWKKFLIWTTITVGIISFVFFPLLTIFHFLTLYKWNLIYSFVLVMGIAFLARFVLLGILKIEQNYKHAKDLFKQENFKLAPAMKPLDKEYERQDE